MPEDSDEYWNRFKTALKQHPPTVDRIAHAIYVARATLAQNEQPLIDDLLNAIYPYTFFADATHHMFWMNLRGILNRKHDPICIAATDLFWPYPGESEPPPINHLQQIVTELAAIRKELEHLKSATQKKRN